MHCTRQRRTKTLVHQHIITKLAIANFTTMAHNYFRISRLIKQSIRSGKYERMLEDEDQPKPTKHNRFLDDEAVDENPIPSPEKAKKHPKRKIVEGKVYKLRSVPGCKRLKKWYPAGEETGES